jgi:hypothetical protein
MRVASLLSLMLILGCGGSSGSKAADASPPDAPMNAADAPMNVVDAPMNLVDAPIHIDGAVPPAIDAALSMIDAACTVGTNLNCAFCGDVCALPNATSNCIGGVCTATMCNPGFMECDGIPGDGCERNIANDPNNCGDCMHMCPYGPHSTAICTSGTCGLVCDSGYDDCDGDPSTGCEINLNVDTNNCGTCMHQCNLANAFNACVGGHCDIVFCNPPNFSDCNMDPMDGCEIDLTTDPSNCGACMNACPFGPHSTAICTPTPGGGMCGIACDPGYVDCDLNPATGCETPGTTCT